MSPSVGFHEPNGSGGIAVPPNQTLIFDIRLISTTPAAKRGEKGYIPDPSEKDDQ